MKKILSIMLVLCMLLSCASYAIPVLDTAEGAECVTEAFASLSAEEVKPGLNMWTGTESAFTFDGATASDFSLHGGATLATNGTNTYMNMAGSFPHFTISKTLPVVEMDRPVRVSFKTLIPSGSAKGFRVIRNKTNATEPSFFQQALASHATIWQSVDKVIKGADKAVTGGTDDTQDIKKLIIMVANDCTSSNVYIDDVKVVPYYKVNYNANGGTGTVAPDYFENGTYSDLDDGSALTKTGAKFAGWSLTAGGAVVTSVTATPGSDITLYAVWESTLAKPGINVWTGNANPYTFEGTTANDYYAYGGAALVNNGSNTYMEYSGSSSHFALKKSLPVIDKDRQVKVSFKAQADSAAAKSVFLVRNTMNNFNPSLGLVYTTFTTSWATYTKDVIGSSQAVTNNSSIFKDDTQDIKQLILISQSNNSSNKIRIDDVSVVPYYKVTYDANGGVTAPAEAWWLPASTDGKYTVSSEISMRAGYKFAGWSLDGVNAVTEVTPANEDIVLVALWEEDPNQQSVEYSFTSNVPGVADGTISLIAPSASYTTATIYLANENGVLEGYTAFGTASLTKGFGSYTITGNRAFVTDATALEIVFSGEGVSNVTKTFEIPASHRMPVSTPLYTFYAVSDMHLGGSATNIDYFYAQWQNPKPIRVNALGNGEKSGDVFSGVADFVVINGDLVNQGSYITEGTDVGEERYWNVLDSYIDERLNIHGIPVFLTNGNHEFYQNDRMNKDGSFKPERLISAITGQVDYIEENYNKTVEIIRDTENENALWYAANMYGTKYIFMSTPELSEDKLTGSYTVSDKQLAFVEAQLEDAKSIGNTAFIMTHMPISETANKDDVEALLSKYPNTVVFNSHTHVDLSADTHNTVVGNMTTTYTTCDTGSVISSKLLSTGQLVEVYEDKVIIKARHFAENSEFYGHAIYLIDTPDETAYENAKPVTLEAQEMRINKVDGNVTSSIRFKATVTAKQKNAASEYGIITTRKTFLEITGEELTFGFEKDGKALYAYGAAYKLDENGKVVTDNITSTEDNGDITFAAVLVGLQNNNADHVNETFVTRSYIKYTNGAKEYTFYGNTAENSLAGVAKNVDTSALSDDYKTAIENIVKLAK